MSAIYSFVGANFDKPPRRSLTAAARAFVEFMGSSKTYALFRRVLPVVVLLGTANGTVLFNAIEAQGPYNRHHLLNSKKPLLLKPVTKRDCANGGNPAEIMAQLLAIACAGLGRARRWPESKGSAHSLCNHVLLLFKLLLFKLPLVLICHHTH